MRILKIIDDTNHIQLVQPTEEKELSFFQFSCKSRFKEWDKPLSVYVWNPATEAKNFYRLTSGILVFDEKVLDVCQTVFEMAGEILPLQVERGEKLNILNVLQCRNGLNYDTTQWCYYKDGTKGHILEYGFHPERVMDESTIFKIPEEIKTSIFCYADVKNPDDEFYHIYHKHKLTGLIFEEVYNDEQTI
jgi:hypothetical protein